MADEGQGDLGTVPYPLPAGIIVDRGVRVQMRDGVHLTATVCRPEAEGRYPVVICVTVCGKDFGPNDYSTLPKIKASGNAVRTIHISDAMTWEGPDPGFWGAEWLCRRGGERERLLRQRGRGRHLRGPRPAGLCRPHRMGRRATVEQRGGRLKWRPQHLKAIIPWEGVSDLLRDVVDHGGIPETRFLKGYYSGSLARGAGDDIAEHGGAMMRRSAEVPFPLENIDVPTLVCGS